MDDALAHRIGRLEATDEIRQLAARYALALDSRDVATLVSLFVEDVSTGEGRTGREASATTWHTSSTRSGGSWGSPSTGPS